jgi:hypothetical protein
MCYHGTVQHVCNMIGSFLKQLCHGDVKVEAERHPEPGEWYRVPRTAGEPQKLGLCVGGEAECQKVHSACPRRLFEWNMQVILIMPDQERESRR